MKDHLIITAHRLLKEYRIYDKPADRLRELFSKKAYHRIFRALGPVDLAIRRGETFGIIGENGAGKSTFLKIVAGVIEPTSGEITKSGRISSILELGTGFNPEFSGRENVALNASLLGLTPSEIRREMPNIEKFAELGEFFDMPVKMYSSGMYMRLAFSLAVHVDADIVIIDEALAVGDGAYEKKCHDKIWELRRNGATILFCSHSLYAVTNFCERVMWLRSGGVEAIGETKAVVEQYEDYLRERESRQKKEQVVVPLNHDERKVAKVMSVRLSSGGAAIEDRISYGAALDVIVDFEILELASVYLGFAVDRNDGLCCYAQTMKKCGEQPFGGKGRYQAGIRINKFVLLGGAYKVVVFLLDDSGICVYDRAESPVFKVTTEEKEWGVCRLDFTWIR